MFLQVFFAVHLNREFYREHAPFFDSCAYSIQMVQVARLTQSDGVAAGIKSALSGNVALPFLETVAASTVGLPDRTFGIWLQWIWLVALALSLYWYLKRYRGASPTVALCLVLPLISFSRIYDWNGGLPDFRMDLSLYIFVGITVVWFLVTYETDDTWPWMLAGMAAGLACLGRATAPIYLLMMIGPLLAIRFIYDQNRVRLLRNCLIMALPITIAVFVFLVHNFDNLYFYYVLWSPDANRHLPLRESATHFLFAGLHMGFSGARLALVALAIQLIVRWRWKVTDFDWRLVWLAAAAPLFLALRGAGLNGFVSMPAMLGLLLFPLIPFRKGPLLPAAPQLQAAICLIACGVAGVGIYEASHGQFLSGTNPTSMVAMKEILNRMSAVAGTRSDKTVQYVMPVVGEMHGCSIQNVLRFNYGATAVAGGFKSDTGVIFIFPREDAFAASDQFLWARSMPNLTEEQRMSELVVLAMKNADGPVLPTTRGLAFLERERPYNLINLKFRELEARLLATGAWQAVGDPVDFSAEEQYCIYRRTVGR